MIFYHETLLLIVVSIVGLAVVIKILLTIFKNKNK
jgi:hypothetical protein